ncbi:MAG TPA: response regulator [Blastocatellia bacterium]|nr:response regulator [Blastocatellia bacterium]
MGKRILIADDERFIREMLKAILTNEGYEVITAEDGQRAVEMAWRERPDLMLIDGLMPKMHGFVACKKIKEFTAPPKIIILTAVYTKPNYKWEAKREYEADDLLLKPFNVDELLECVRKHLPEDSNPRSANLAQRRANEERADPSVCVIYPSKKKA